MFTLGIESSCDDTAVAVLRDDTAVLANVVSSQDSIHERFGGVVPELASRNHLLAIQPLIHSALQQSALHLEDIDLVAVTQGPGLIGSLLVGFSYAKAMSYVAKIPFVGVDHMAGHLFSVFLGEKHPSFPFIALIVSGGTSSIYICNSFTSFTLLGRTRDDAAGEAFDKVAKLLGLGYPGGPLVSQYAARGDANRFLFPRAWLEKDSYDFSFSGLKTAVLQTYKKHYPELQKNESQLIPDICASFQQAVVDVLIQKTITAARNNSITTVVLGGGVSANSELRTKMTEQCAIHGISLFLPDLAYCTDNAAMIALAGYHKYKKINIANDFDTDVFSRSIYN